MCVLACVYVFICLPVCIMCHACICAHIVFACAYVYAPEILRITYYQESAEHLVGAVTSTEL